MIINKDIGTLVTTDVLDIATGIDKALTSAVNHEQLISFARTHTWDDVANKCVNFYAKHVYTQI